MLFATSTISAGVSKSVESWDKFFSLSSLIKHNNAET